MYITEMKNKAFLDKLFNKQEIKHMEKLAIATIQRDLVSLVKLVTEQNKIYEIESGNASAILISQKEYEGLQETIELLSISGLRESLQRSLEQIIHNETYSFDDVLGDVD
jgi:antitoxin YefM